MKTEDAKKAIAISQRDLALFGGGAVAYIREIADAEAKRLLGEAKPIAPNTRLFCLYNADGSPVSISGTREAALGSAFEHELMPMSVH